jgi:hypothetical protein
VGLCCRCGSLERFAFAFAFRQVAIRGLAAVSALIPMALSNLRPLLTPSEASMRIPKSVSGPVFLCIILTLPSPLHAQFEIGQIACTVMDQTGAALPNAGVAIENLSTKTVRNSVSSSSGAYPVST